MLEYQKLKDNTKDTAEFQEQLNLLLSNMPVITIKFSGKLYRGRLFEENEQVNNISDISYVPNPEWISGYGRANRPGQSIFYCAESFQTIFFECMILRDGKAPSVRDKIIFGEWVSIDSLDLVIIVQPNFLKRTGFFDKTYGYEFDKIAKSSLEVTQMMNFLYQTYTERARTNRDYVLPALVSNYFYQKYGGILYPSTSFANGGYNIAIRPDLLKDKLAISKVVEHRFDWGISAGAASDSGDFTEALFIDKKSGYIKW